MFGVDRGFEAGDRLTLDDFLNTQYNVVSVDPQQTPSGRLVFVRVGVVKINEEVL